MKRILQIKQGLLCDGVVVLHYRLSKALQDEVVFDWFISDAKGMLDENMEKKFQRFGCKIFQHHSLNINLHSWLLNNLYRLITSYFFFKKHKYEVVYCNTESASMVITLLAAKLAGVRRRVLHSHNSQSQGGGTPKYKIDFYKKIMPYVVTDYFTCSEMASKWLFPENVLSKAILIKNGLETNLFWFNSDIRIRIRQEMGVAEDCFVIGHVGRFAEQKNHKKIIGIFNQIVSINPNSRLLLIGDGELKNEIKNLVSSMHLTDKVSFISNTDKTYEFYQAMDLYLMPSLHEGLSLTCIEAQTAGLKCVFADTMDRASDITGRCKFLPLSESDKFWANECLAARTRINERAYCYKSTLDSSYDINTTAQQIKEILLS